MKEKKIIFEDMEVVFGKTTASTIVGKGFNLVNIYESTSEPPVTQCQIEKDGVCYGYLYFFKKMVYPTAEDLYNEPIGLLVIEKKRSKVKENVKDAKMSTKKAKIVNNLKTSAKVHSVSFIIAVVVNYIFGIQNLLNDYFIALLILLFAPTVVIATIIFPKEETLGKKTDKINFFDQMHNFPILMINFFITYLYVIYIMNNL